MRPLGAVLSTDNWRAGMSGLAGAKERLLARLHWDSQIGTEPQPWDTARMAFLRNGRALGRSLHDALHQTLEERYETIR